MAMKGVTVWVLILGFIEQSLTTLVNGDSSDCSFPAIYNFGDSNSATGTPLYPPYGETYFGKPSGRLSDGRLIIDFICEELKLKYLNPYPNTTEADFSNGANFAVGGATIRPGGFVESNLGLQTSLFQEFKAHSSKHPDDFSRSLYTFDIGTNDLGNGFRQTSEDGVRASIPDILEQFAASILLVYSEGARIFWIHNIGPIGCIPNSVIYYTSNINYTSDSGNFDESGCVKPWNTVAEDFNKQLKERLAVLRTHLPDTVFIYVDVYSAKYSLTRDAQNQGFVDPLKICCETCEMVALFGGSCSNPSEYIFWDGSHYTESANQWVAKRILFGPLSDTPMTNLNYRSMS